MKLAPHHADPQKIEQALATAESRFRILVESIREFALYMLDTEGNVLSWNNGAQHMFGYTNSEIIGQPVEKLYPEGDAWLGKPRYELKVALREQKYESEGWRIHQDGSVFWARVNITPMFEDDIHIGYVHITQDLNERKQLQDQILQAQSAVENARVENKKRNMFFALMSHELRTPLNAIIGFSDLLSKGYAGPLSEKQKRYAHNVSVSGHHLLQMVNDILDISKIEAGRLKIYPETLQLSRLIQDVKSVVDFLGAEKQIDLEFDIPEKMEEIYADPTRLRQILFNLISNAIKFNQKNGIVRIRFRKLEHQPYVACQVQDTGIGIPKEKMNRLFTEFFQVDSGKARTREGTGLGLALTKKLVELHGGHIAVDSQEGNGTTFTFTLPQEKVPELPSKT